MRHEDTRTRFTKTVLKEALLKILKEKPISKVTIKEICETAHINRGTFYLHYNEPNDLLREIEKDFWRENMAFFDTYMKNDNPEQLIMLFAAMLKNRELSMILFGEHGAPQFSTRIKNVQKDIVLNEWQREFPDYRREDLDFVYEFLYSGAVRLILNWIENDSGITPDELGKRLDILGHYCHLAIKEFQ